MYAKQVTSGVLGLLEITSSMPQWGKEHKMSAQFGDKYVCRTLDEEQIQSIK